MKRMLGRLIAFCIAFAALFAAFVYLLGPHAQVSAAFARYKAAIMSGDRQTVAAMTAPKEIAFMQSIGLHALKSGREIVSGLPFRDRYLVFALRARVRQGDLQKTGLSLENPVAAYAAMLDLSSQSAARYKEIDVLFAVPVGMNASRGYFSLTRLPGVGLQKAAMALAFGAYFLFEKSNDGWLVDPTPLTEGSAAENESYAVMVEPSGNAYIFNLLGAKDFASQELLSTPLEAAS